MNTQKSRWSARICFFAGHIANPISNCFALKQFANRVPRAAAFPLLISQARPHFFPCKSRANGAQAIFPVVPTSFLVRLVVSPHRGNNGRAQGVGVGGFKGERRKHRGAGERNMAAENFMGVLWRQKGEKREREGEESRSLAFRCKTFRIILLHRSFRSFLPSNRPFVSFLFSFILLYYFPSFVFSTRVSKAIWRKKEWNLWAVWWASRMLVGRCFLWNIF